MPVASFIDVERELLSIRREVARQRNEDRLIRQKLSHAAGSSTAGLFYASDPAGEHSDLSGLNDPDHPQYFYLAGEYADAKLFSGADSYWYSDAGSTIKAQLYGATGNFDLAGDIEFQTDGSFIGLGPSSSRTVYNSAGSEASLRSAADFALYSSADTSTEKLRLDGATGSVYTADNAEVGVNGGGRTVYSTSGSEVSLRSGADIALYLSADTSNEKLRLDGATGSVYVADAAEVGISGGIRLVFDATASPDQLEVTGGDLYFATTNRGIKHIDGVTEGMVLRANGTRYIPTVLDIDHLADTDLSDPSADRIVFWDDSASQLTWLVPNAGLSVSTVYLNVDHDSAMNFIFDEHIDHSSVDLTAGDGLTGGGDITQDRTFTLGTPSTLTVSTINNVTAGSHTHAITASAAIVGSTSALLKSDADGYLQVEGLGVGAAASTDHAIVLTSNGWIGRSTNHYIEFRDESDDKIYFKTASGGSALSTYYEASNDRAVLRLDPGNAFDDQYLVMRNTVLLSDETGDQATLETYLNKFRIAGGTASYIEIEDGDLRVPSGVYAGSVATAPGTGYIRATTFVSGFLPFATYDRNDLYNISVDETLLACSLPGSCTLRYMRLSAYVASPNSGTDYWTITLRNQATTSRAEVDTSAISVATWTSIADTGLSVSMTTASDPFLYIECVKTGTPGNLSLGCPAVFVE